MSLKQNALLKQLLTYVGPAVLGLLVNAFYNIVDRILVGRFVGAEGLSAVTMVFPVNLLQFGFILLFGSGAGVLIAKYLGESRTDKAELVLGNMIAGLLIIIFLFTTTGLLFYKELLIAFGAEGSLLNMSGDYLQVIIYGFPLSFFIALEFTCRAEGNPRLPAILVLISSVINILLDIVFMKGFNMGIKGAALATIIAQGVNSLCLIYYYFGGQSLIKLTIKKIKLQKNTIYPMLLLGFSPFIMDCATSFQNMIANNLLLKTGGSDAVAVMGIIFGINTFFLMTALGIGDGIQPLISYNLGAKKHLKNYKILIYTMTMVVSIGLIGVVIIQTFPNTIISVFIENNMNIINLAETALRIFSICIPFYMVQIIATRYFQALHKNKIAIFLALLRPVILFIPFIYVLNTLYNLNGIWITFVLTDSVAAFISILFIKNVYTTKPKI
ncbi:MATE family efflux transporter [Formosa sediminum]|nr:MATE family efflux transporter [Formosa sediminum]